MNWKNDAELSSKIDDAIKNSIEGLVSKHEPDYIAALMKKMPNSLSDILKSEVPSVKFNIGGYFIHQKPLAKFCNSRESKKSAEIGDLLIVYKEIRENVDVCNALLLQAKKTTDIYRTTVHSNDQHQLLLYTKWPRFKYARAGKLNGKIRSVTPKTITPGAQYLLIGESPYYDSPLLGCAMPDKTLDASKSFASELIDLMRFRTGRPFASKPIKTDHWSRMIWDLLEISATSVFNLRTSGFKNERRASDDIISMLSTYKEITNNQNAYGPILSEDGISILCIEAYVTNDNNYNQ